LLELARFKFLKNKILNRVSTKGSKIPNAEYKMKMTDVALDAT
jgi:hypothetical protein